MNASALLCVRAAGFAGAVAGSQHEGQAAGRSRGFRNRGQRDKSRSGGSVAWALSRSCRSRAIWGRAHCVRISRGRLIAAVGDLDRSTVHEELLLAVVPSPREDHVPCREISGDREWKGLVRGISPAVVALRAVAFVAGNNAEGGAVVDGEAYLTGTAPVITTIRCCRRVSTCFRVAMKVRNLPGPQMLQFCWLPAGQVATGAPSGVPKRSR